MQTHPYELDWGGVRVLGKDPLPVMKALYYLMNANLGTRWESYQKSFTTESFQIPRITIVLDLHNLRTFLTHLDRRTQLGLVLMSQDQRSSLLSNYLKPDAWFSTSTPLDGDGSYLTKDKDCVVTNWRGAKTVTSVPDWIKTSNLPDQVAYVCATFAFSLRHSCHREALDLHTI